MISGISDSKAFDGLDLPVGKLSFTTERLRDLALAGFSFPKAIVAVSPLFSRVSYRYSQEKELSTAELLKETLGSAFLDSSEYLSL